VHSQPATIRAHVRPTVPALVAEQAGEDRPEGDVVAGSDPVDPFTHARHHSGSLVPHHHARPAPASRPEVAVDVRAADPRRMDGDHDLAGARDGIGPLLEAQLFGAVVDEGPHR